MASTTKTEPGATRAMSAASPCTHESMINLEVEPNSHGCIDCLASGGTWKHLRVCLTCGFVGCCDDSPGRHAMAHFRATQHPVVCSYEPNESWRWCYIDETFLDWE